MSEYAIGLLRHATTDGMQKIARELSRLAPPPPETSQMDVQQAVSSELVRRIAQVRAEIARADAKASLLVAGTTTLVALGVATMGSVSTPAAALGWLAIGAAGAAIGMCGLVVMPCRGLGPQAGSVPETIEAIAHARLAEHAQIVQIALKKFMRLRYAVGALAVAAVLAVAAGITATTL